MILTRKFLYQSSKGEEIFFALDSDFILNSIKGIDSNIVDIKSTYSIGQIGSTVNYKHIKDKNITINGAIKKDTEINREKLLNAVLPADDAKLFCILDNGDRSYIDVTPVTTPIIDNVDHGAKFQIVLNCPYPFWKDSGINSSTLNGIQPRFRFPRNFSGVWQIATSIATEFVNVRNTGNQSIGMEINLKAD